MMTSGQDGSYFDVASNSFVDNSRGYRGGPIPAPPRRARRGNRDGSKKTLALGISHASRTQHSMPQGHQPLLKRD